MAPPRKRITPLGNLLRQGREALSLTQDELARRVFVSKRQISRWENGVYPPDDAHLKLFNALSAGPEALVDALGDALDLVLVEPAAAPAPPSPPPLPPPPAPPAPASAELRASLDAIILSVAEERDLLPRHLREFAVAILQGVDRLGLSAREAALLVAPAKGAGDGAGPFSRTSR